MILFSLLSCRKDFHQVENDNYNHPQRHSGGQSFTISQVDFNRDWLVDFVVDLQVANDSLQFYNGMVQRHGIVRWNMAMFFEGDQGRRFITVPLERSNRILAVILGERVNGTYQFYFYTKDSILNIVNNPQSTSQEVLSIHLPALSIIINDRLYFARPNPILSNWMEQNGTLKDKYGNIVSRDGFNCDMILYHAYIRFNDGTEVLDYTTILGIECTGNNVDGTWMNPGSGPNITEGSNPGSGSNPGDGDPNNESEPDDLINYLTPAQLACLWKGLEQSAVLALTDLIQSTFYEGCNQVPTQSVVDKILEELCNQLTSDDLIDFDGPVDLSGAQAQEALMTLISGDDVYGSLPGGIRNGLVKNCKFFSCALELAIDETYNLNCLDALNNIQESNLSVLFHNNSGLYLDDNNQPNSNYTAFVVPIINKANQIQVVINPNKCSPPTETSFINYFESIHAIYHELIHVEIFRKLKEECGWNGTDETTLADAFHKLVKEEFQTEYPSAEQHYLMLENYVDEIQESLWALNGFKGDINDYYWMVLQSFGSNPDILDYCAMSPSFIEYKYLNEFLPWINNVNNQNSSIIQFINDCISN